jgi:hypothetical protein
VHGDAVSAGRLLAFGKAEEQQSFARPALVILEVLMAKMLLDYEALFVEARAIIAGFPILHSLASSLASFAREVQRSQN